MSPKSITLEGIVVRSEPNHKRTTGNFGKFIKDNQAVFEKYFRTNLFAGSLNIQVSNAPRLQSDLDDGKYEPAFTIPRSELVGMPAYIGAGQAWVARIKSEKLPDPILCWIFRRIGSQVPERIIEVLAEDGLASTYGLDNGDHVELTVYYEN